MPALDRTGQQIAHEYGAQIRCLIAECPFDLSRIKQTQYGTSNYRVGGHAYWMQTTSKGIELTEEPGDPHLLILRWGELTRHINGLPDSLRQEARDVDRDAHRPPASHLEWHDFRYPKPITEAQWLAYLLWNNHVEARTNRVLDAAFPLAVTDEATDLFELAGVSA